MSPKVSVIIPVFNHGRELEACLASLDAQTFRDFEVIVVDDGSNEPVRKTQNAKRKIEWIRFEDNRGAPAARNEGFRRSKGAYVIFLDADAELRPDALERMASALDARPEIDFAYPSFVYGWKSFKGRRFDERALHEANYIHTSALIRRGAFPGFDESLKKFQDWDLFLTMGERGSRGYWIDEYLFTIKPHGTMSSWMPRIAYRIPWPAFGWMPESIGRFREAERIIREKHGIQPTGDAANAFSRSALGGSDRKARAVAGPVGWFGFIFLIEALSAVAVFHPAASSVFAVMAGIAMFIATLLRPEAGFAAMVVEHVIGSKGRQFAFGADASHDGGVSLRIILFCAFFLGWFAHLLKTRRMPDLRAMLEGRAAWLVLGVFVLLGAFRGWMRGNPYLVADANAWGAFLLLAPALDLATNRHAAWLALVERAAKLSIAWVSAKTLALFYFFSHDFGAVWGPVYLWVRRTGVGEVTRIIKDASAFRVFFQSHVYQVLVAVGLGAQLANRKSHIVHRNVLKALAILFAVIIISFSRSFWIGAFIGFVLVFGLMLQQKMWRRIPTFVMSGVVALLIVFALFAFPFPPSAGNLGDAILARADTGEDAAQSRWELLPVLHREILASPFIGHGFGKTATYQSSDPRIVSATGGEYTTYAFEWGWHDMAMKIGLLGILAYLWVIGSLLKRLGSERRAWQIAILTLCIIHIFTPYLNHPLGILVLVVAEGLTAEHSRSLDETSPIA